MGFSVSVFLVPFELPFDQLSYGKQAMQCVHIHISLHGEGLIGDVYEGKLR